MSYLTDRSFSVIVFLNTTGLFIFLFTCFCLCPTLINIKFHSAALIHKTIFTFKQKLTATLKGLFNCFGFISWMALTCLAYVNNTYQFIGRPNGLKVIFASP